MEYSRRGWNGVKQKTILNYINFKIYYNFEDYQ